MIRHYILNANGDPALADLWTWAAWMETSGDARQLARDELPGGVTVSTVFLGLDHRLVGAGPPVLWETMVFGSALDQQIERYTSRADALKGHARVAAAVLALN